MFVDYEKSVFRLGLLDEEALLQAPISSRSCGSSSLSKESKGLIGTGAAIFVLMVAVGFLAWRLVCNLREREALLSRQTDELNQVRGELGELRARPSVQPPPPPRPNSPVITENDTD